MATTRENKVCSVASGLPFKLLTALQIHVPVVWWADFGDEGVLLVNWTKETRDLNIEWDLVPE